MTGRQGVVAVGDGYMTIVMQSYLATDIYDG